MNNNITRKKKACVIRQAIFAFSVLIALCAHTAIAQKTETVIKASNQKATIDDGENVHMDWKLDPQSNPDIYYVNVPFKKSTVRFKTDQDQLIFHTKPGKTYTFIVLLNEKDSCRVRIVSGLPAELPAMTAPDKYLTSIPFEMIGSKVFLKGLINGKEVKIQFDLGAGTSVVNRNSSEKLALEFSAHTIVSNTEGVNKERTSTGNLLNIGSISWSSVPLTEVGNMKAYEDLIIGNSFFRNHIIEIDYDNKQFIIHKKLPDKIAGYTKLPIFYEQNRPKFRAKITHNEKNYSFWFLFDTGRDGSMLLGEDFTSKDDNWKQLLPLTIINGRKIVRLDATIAGVCFKDIVTNAADPEKPGGRPSLFGNQILSHFNLILDNVNGFIYLKTNRRTKEPYSNYDDYLKEMEKIKKK
ncbi:retroviral-like aspartic protease family protein [Dyadobacter sp. CY356]|uniref:retroviral-like aspartic protease family protein n=1 Tax=Dyadobacter sp. CY356 TaxID=2906442 RepID=UPI001F3BC464|nr:aspartyl protease family protein [Dyadobacter sp. CY356]MCF0055235.1 aspartyl protease family protein [Dyadobacter sp. CY356]